MDIVLTICGEVELAFERNALKNLALGKDLLRNGTENFTQSYFLKWLLREDFRSTLWVDFLDHDYL